jgi:RNA polymerase sigma-70 factor (ECF subfamily)
MTAPEPPPTAVSVPDFERLAAEVRPDLFRAALAVTLDRGDAEDVVQDALAAAYRSWTTVGALDRPDLWIRRVAVNRAIDLRRRRHRFTGVFRRLTGSASVRTELGDTVAFWDAVGRLTPRQQEVVVLRSVEELSVEEIAVALEVAEGTVKSTLHAARTRLADLLAEVPVPTSPSASPASENGATR